MSYHFGEEFDVQDESPLYSKSAEMSVLGSILLIGDAEDVRPLLAEVTSGMFYRPAHRILFTVLEFVAITGTALDIVTVATALNDKGKMDDVGGPDYLLEIAQYVPSPANVRHYIDIVREKAARRSLASKWSKCLKAIETADLSELVNMDNKPAHGVGNVKNPVSHIKQVELSSKSTEAVSSGFTAIDLQSGCGGWAIEQMSVVSATHKGGKTTLMLSSFTNMVTAGKCCLYASLGDMSESKLKSRMMRNITGFSRRPYQDAFDAEDFDDALARINSLKAYFYDSTCTKEGRNVEALCRWIEAAHSQYRFDAVFIDYAQLIRCSIKKNMTKVEEQDEACAMLAELAGRLKIAIIVGSQVTKTDDGEDVTKYSRKWEEDAGITLRITGDEENTRTIQVVRNRHGHQKQKFVMTWNSDRLRFEDRAA